MTKKGVGPEIHGSSHSDKNPTKLARSSLKTQKRRRAQEEDIPQNAPCRSGGAPFLKGRKN